MEAAGGTNDGLASVPELVYFSLLMAVIKIDELNDAVTFDFVCFLSWAPKTANFDKKSSTTTKFAKISEDALEWKPSIELFNVKQKTTIEETYYKDASSGCTACLLNWVLEGYEVLELHQFPFDRQLVKLKFAANGVHLTPIKSLENGGIPNPPSFPTPEKQAKCIVSLGNWHLNDTNVSMELTNAEGDSVDTEVAYVVELSRKSAFYLWNIVLVIFVLILSSFCVVGVPIDDLSARMSITMTITLALVAFKFVISGMVPPTPYLTFLDKYVLFSFVVIGTVVVENFILSYNNANDNSGKFESIFYSILVTLWLISHIYLAIGAYLGWFYTSWEKVRKNDDSSREVSVKTSQDVFFEGVDDAAEDSSSKGVELGTLFPAGPPTGPGVSGRPPPPPPG